MADGMHDISSDRGDTRPFALLEHLAGVATMVFNTLMTAAQRFSEHVETTRRQHAEEDLINDLLLSHGRSTRDKALVVRDGIQPGSNSIQLSCDPSRAIPSLP